MNRRLLIISCCVGIALLFSGASYFASAQTGGTVPTPTPTPSPTPTPTPTPPPATPTPTPPPPNVLPAGYLDVVDAAGVVTGWAYDPDTPATSIVVRFYLDGTATPLSGTYIGEVTANVYREDVNAALGITGNHGFSFTIPAQYRNGIQHSLRAFGRDTSSTSIYALLNGSPRTYLLGVITPTPVPTPTPTAGPTPPSNILPVGNFESIDASGNAIGWAYDPNSSASSIRIEFYLNARAGFGGTFLGSTIANVSRPDINATYNITGNHGFSYSIPAKYRDGTQYSIWAYGMDSTSGSTTLAGSPKTFTLGSLPTPTPSPAPCVGVVFPQNFDGVSAPALPADWRSVNATGAGISTSDLTLWTTSTNTSDTALNNAFLPNSVVKTDKYLITPGLEVTSTSPVLNFRNNFSFEYSGSSYRDGGVLEVSSPNINGGAFTDVTNAAVGGSFALGGYNHTLATASGSTANPLQGRLAWSGNSGGYISTLVNLGPNLQGRIIYLRFRMGTNSTLGAPGWRIDTISFTGGGACQGSGATPTPTPSPTPTPTPALSCDADWELNLDYTSSDAVRGGEVDFTLSLPATSFGHIPNNPRISNAYQYPDIAVVDPTMQITTGSGAEDDEYTGTIQMASADAVVVKFDLWCSSPQGEFFLMRTYDWTVQQSNSPTPPRVPTGVTSDIRYVSFLFMVDSDVARDPLGVTLESQIQLRNLKSNL